MAVVRDPHHTLPLDCTYEGIFASDSLGMDVQVSVTSGTPEAHLGHSPTLHAPTIRPTGLIEHRDVGQGPIELREAGTSISIALVVRRSRSAGSGVDAAAAMAAAMAGSFGH